MDMKSLAAVVFGWILAGHLYASEPLDLSVPETDEHRFDFQDTRLAGFERRKVTSDLRLRGWDVGNGIYFGQAKVGRKWGVGFLYEDGDTVYGLNNRGLQVVKKL